MSKSKFDELLNELYQAKERLRDLAPKYGSEKERRELMHRKDEILRQIRQELRKLSKVEAEKIKDKLRKDLGVII